MIQTSIFDMLYPKFKIDKPIKLITLFSGYDSQALSLKYLGVQFEHHRTCEWAVKSIQALKDLHFPDVEVECNLDKKQLVEFLYEKGVSANYNEPMNKQQLERMSEPQLANIYKNIKSTNNLVNIQKASAEDLDISHTDIYTYILTYSFPCQDLSVGGKRQLMGDTSTRSGMLWEVERLLTECKEKPQVLLMENVVQVHGEGAVQDFNKWQLRLEELGYKNYWEDLVATDYGIPQSRNRCFMVSILGDYSYSFPPKQELKLKLKDLLEPNVDEKYYLSDKLIDCFMSEKSMGTMTRKERFLQNINRENQDIANTLTTLEGNRATDTFIVSKHLRETLEQNNEITDGAFIDAYNRKIRNNNLAATLTTRINDGNDTFVAVNEVSMRIRKLTPKECFRLMGVKDEDYEKIAKNQSNASLYHLAGDSIVVQCLMAIFKEML